MTDTAPSFLAVQQESITFNEPVSESAITSIAALANALRVIMLPIGSVVDSLLTEAQWHMEVGDATRWVIADGRSVSGSAYQILTGNANVPDITGSFRRAQGASNPDGVLPLGTFTAAKFLSHTHTLTDPGHFHQVPGKASGGTSGAPNFAVDNPVNGTAPTDQINVSVAHTGISIATIGGNDTAPANVTVNTFIRIN